MSQLGVVTVASWKLQICLCLVNVGDIQQTWYRCSPLPSDKTGQNKLFVSTLS